MHRLLRPAWGAVDAVATLARNVVKYTVLRDVFTLRSDRFGREHMAELAVRFAVANGLDGAYLEFGVFRGSTFAQFYHLLRRHALPLPMVAFDSFRGLPPPRGIDAVPGFARFHAGAFVCSEEDFVEALASRWVPRNAYTIVPGYYEDSLTDDLRKELALPPAAIVWIDCVLYESVSTVLRFVEPLLQDGTLLVFNDYFRFKGHPAFGERRAFDEFLALHPHVRATDYARFGSVGQAFLIHLVPQPAA